MALDLHVSGPGVDVHRRLAPGDPALILGRDSDCAVCLPDAGRSVSRRHLSVWNEGDLLHFHVLSVVNGVESAAGELPPGARGVLGSGEMLGLAAFRILVTAEPEVLAAADDEASDPWAEFARQVEQLVPEVTTPGAIASEDDPFDDWGFQSTFGPGAAAGSLQADALAPATDLQPFFAGLGVQPGGSGALTRGELETIGRVTRIAVQGLLQAGLSAATTQSRTDDRTTLEPRELNPLRLEAPLQSKLQYLFGGLAASAGFVPPDRAVGQVAAELAAHQQAMGEAVQEAVQKVVEEFDPEALKKRLLKGGARMFGSARAWDAFVKDYAQRTRGDAHWVQLLVDRHFARAYARAIVRAKRNTPGRPQG
jgi:predicted component of type VI protein secretion system